MRLTFFLTILLSLAAAAIPLGPNPGLAAPADAASPRSAPVQDRSWNGIRLLALQPEPGARFDVSIVQPEQGLDHIAAALDLIARKSPASAAVIDRLKASGRVSLVYFPNDFRDRNRPNAQTVALFLPDFLKQRGLGTPGLEFAVVINQFGVKWPAGELAAVIVHELAGHGLQHLEGRIVNARVLDLECEASLYQERAYQDLGVAKKSRAVVLFRRQMEDRYCADFRAYMRARAPSRLALWDALNPDVPALLALFADYHRAQTAQRGPVAGPLSARSR